jgi:hypothetical protein
VQFFFWAVRIKSLKVSNLVSAAKVYKVSTIKEYDEVHGADHRCSLLTRLSPTYIRPEGSLTPPDELAYPQSTLPQENVNGYQTFTGAHITCLNRKPNSISTIK